MLLAVTINLSGSAVSIQGGGGADSVALRVSANGNLECSKDGGVNYSQDLSDSLPGTQTLLASEVSAIAANMGDGKDILTLDFGSGIPIPITGTTYNGNQNTDRIVVIADANSRRR